MTHATDISRRMAHITDSARLLDLALGLPLLVFLAPLLGCIAAALWASGTRPVFCGRRFVGRGGAPRIAHDFRTRGGRTAAFIQAAGLEVLPRLLNVVKGEMSLVGPRPLSPSEVSIYGDAFESYCSVRPGLTGNWAIRSVPASNLGARSVIDREYVAVKSWRTDLLILLQVLAADVLGRSEA